VVDGAGKKWSYKVSRAGNQLNVRIGDANRFVDGHQTYVITYQVENAVLFFNDHDELYWNVTGNNWKATIQEAVADVDIKGKDKSLKLWAAAYTGILGSRDSDCTYETSDNRGRFSTKKALKPGEGLTIAFGWTKVSSFLPRRGRDSCGQPTSEKTGCSCSPFSHSSAWPTSGTGEAEIPG